MVQNKSDMFNMVNGVSEMEHFKAVNTIYVADLPKNTSYMDIAPIFEKLGSCEILIKRYLY